MGCRGFRLFGLVFIAAVATSIQGAELQRPVTVPVIERSLAPAAEPVVSVDSIRQPISQAERKRIASILELLDRADRAIKNKRLAEPPGDNAADYYRQVLKLQPGYEEAVRGLDKIVDRYLQWSDAATRQGRDEAALHYLALARKIKPESAKVDKAAKTITLQPAELPRYIRLDARQLKAKSAALVAELGPLADRIRTQSSRITIEAPTDSQGRWIYQQLNQRHEDYRIRANFRLESQPGVRLLD